MHLLVGNPTAHSGKNAARIDVARREMDMRGIEHDFLATRAEGKTVGDVAKALSGGAYKCVVAMGGDGTFAEVAKGLLASGVDVPMGMLPTGTANDQGRSFGLDSATASIARNVDVLHAGQTAPLDAGKITSFDIVDSPLATDWFFDSAGWGISALVLRMRNEDRRLVGGVPILKELYRDQLVYAGAIVKAFLKSYMDEQTFEAEITTPAGTKFIGGITDLVVKNTRIYAGAWVLDETSSPEDGEMELVPFTGRDEWIVRSIVAHEMSPVKEQDLAEFGGALSKVIRSPWFHIRLRDRPGGEPIESQLDGEEWRSATSYRIDVVRHALRLIVPVPE